MLVHLATSSDYASPMPQLPFHRIDDRLSGRAADQTLYEGVPDWLEGPLQNWLWSVTTDYLHILEYEDLARDSLLALRWRAETSQGFREALTLCRKKGDELLLAVDTVIQLHPIWGMLDEDGDFEPRHTASGAADLAVSQLVELDKLLTRGGSYLQVSFEGQHLVRRVDEAAQQAYQKSVEDSPNAAAKHLRNAWDAAFRRAPDPDISYSESVKAVEAVLNPLVVPKDPGPTLGKTLGILKQQCQSGKWKLVLGDVQNHDENIERFVGMVDLLWKNHEHRHAGGPRARSQTQEEAEAVLHLVVLIVQWMNTNALKRL